MLADPVTDIPNLVRPTMVYPDYTFGFKLELPNVTPEIG